ncbi:MAG: ABC transporter ATP-binding protein [Treponema sp.]|nr:ABC transporter ATP-binding protein [Candidatus Treponema merdequi]
MELLKTENLSKNFLRSNKKIEAVKNINFSLEKGKTYGLVGESGCGKSTLASMLCLLTKPDSGKIFFKSKDIHTLSKKETKDFHKKVQIIFQNPYDSLNPKMKIKNIIEEGLIIHKITKSKEEKDYLVNEMRTMCALDNSVLEKYPSELSGGQRQRVSLAASMILQPELLILDEAVSSLDVLVQAQILNILKLMQKSFGTTYLFISHNLHVISYLSDKIGVMYNGSIIEEGKAEDILSNPEQEYTKKLFESSYTIKSSASTIF